MKVTKPILKDAIYKYAFDNYPDSVEELDSFFNERDLNIEEEHSLELNELIDKAPMLFIAYQVWAFFYGTAKEKYKEELKHWLPSITGIIGFFNSNEKKKYLKDKLVKKLEIGVSKSDANKIADKILRILETPNNGKEEHEPELIPFINIYSYIYSFIFFICITLPLSFILFYISHLSYFIITEYISFSVIPSFSEQKEFFDVFSSDFYNAIEDRSLWNYFFLENTYSIIFSLIVTILGLLLVNRVLRILRIKFVNKITFNSTRNNEIELYKLIENKIAKPVKFEILESTSNKPFVSRYKKSSPVIIMPKKYFQSLDNIKTQFIIFHEYYHIINGDYKRNKLLRTVLIVFILLMTLVKIIAFLNPLGVYSNVPISSFLSIIALLLFLTSLIHIVKQNEKRANLFAYKKTKELEIDNIFSKELTFLQRIFYPSSKSIKKYIDSFPRAEISFLHIFLISVATYAPIWAIPSFFDNIAFGTVESLLFFSSFLITIHLIKVNLNFKLSFLKIIFSYFKWIVSMFIIMLIIVGVQKPEALIDNYIYSDILSYIGPFVSVLILVPMIKYFKTNNLVLFLSLIVTAYLIEFGMTYNHPALNETIFIYGVSAIICICYTLTLERIVPLLDKYIKMKK
ncbi:hypothetical protein K8R42_00755 [bacterium]|nr:hypothetical protein [bacterium]